MFASPFLPHLSDAMIASPKQPQSYIDTELVRLVGEAEIHSEASLATNYTLGLDVLGDIELPPGAEAQVDRAQMRALGALYLAADLEPARLIASAELLASLAVSGAITSDLGAVAPLLHAFWQKRNERIDAAERVSFFGGLFGASYGTGVADGYVNKDFESLMLDLCEALYRLDELSAGQIYGGIAQQARLRSAATNLISNLVAVGGGVTAFLALEIMRLLREALSILKHPQLRGVFMARDVWGVVAAINRQARVRTIDPRNFVRRGRAGMTVIVWLADAADALRQQGRPMVRLDHPVISSAVDWLQTSLIISEQQGQPAAYPPDHSPGNTGQWSDIGI